MNSNGFKLKVFTIRDSKVDACMRPFFAQSTKEGIRIWEDSVNSPDSGFFKHPEDYFLYEIGEFDPALGRIYPHTDPIALSSATEVIKSTN